MATVECRSVRKSYGEHEVISDFSLSIEDHEFVVFLGPSGCGKSTILRMVAGLEDITGGDLMIGGRRVNDLDPGDRGIAMVFQNYALYPHMSVRENITFALERAGETKDMIARRLAPVVETLGLQVYLNRKPTELSGGQQQRVAIARAMIKTPEVFLFDEPLSNLDAKLRGHLRVEIARLHKELRSTSIYVTHDQLEAMTLADRIVLMNAGRIEQMGTPEEIYSRPATLFAAGFIGTPGMNFFNLVASGGKLTDGEISIDAPFPLSERPVTVGIRPGAISLVRDGMPGAIPAIADRDEFHGETRLLSLTAGRQSFMVAVPASVRVAEGEQVFVSLAPDQLHLFDTESGARIDA
ncbi:sn-glycerol-3-phosphate ABC transporter ATP-binding protein UgpC [Paracoccus caeni]|uniref:Sn-glycerol-3-phosphate ABC transporter ATP-binding protein UgpC n=1 Tax=Paracoccus caeni TaxID=657651 RepID=A0A934SDF7_9RHOB|nr:sn-glycerol-3-phosphate ABC transporter ATP-binding protein UgpC [Paracoccus caeni]MBK4216845.1 sn-glycerol-3-phosphate ABC transporter ATP-binding protein UgpC [Paracoccus caeni]